jgi:predicted outer membrane protein
MNPTQPNYSVDYLNQIAPQAPKKMRFSRLQYILIAVVGLLVVLTIIFGIIVSSKTSVEPEKQLAARLQSTEKIVGDAQTKLKSSQLRTLNSNLKIYLTNTNRDIAAPLLKSGVDVTKLDKTIVASEAGTDITARLEDARLNAVYDRTYAREISYRLSTLVALMRQINTSTKSQSLKTFLDNAYKNLAPTQKQFDQFNATNG